jgi:hypothetical protein
MADFLINAYVNWKMARPVEFKLCPSYNDVINFIINENGNENNTANNTNESHNELSGN